ncbi:HD-GYP domain-containing protein [Selenihalanaerobacter shriftii]|uniref:HD domain-containing protein n=1 Tax=Selenihalanaerobacter shriftii TaxID=142842 RepID=A0A1T4JJB3_9FIRM|nr:HD domain-containing phosphohydrolase [Selenihalanaerobacter shriftii]SJZ30241.1 HD domain-containing protein [Selenihalanaerobacter shriftii]
MNKVIEVSLFDMIMCLSDAIDLVSKAVSGHHKRVAYIASSIAVEMGLSKEEERNLIMAGALHDAGAISLQERLQALKFDTTYAYSSEETCQHAQIGYHLIKQFEPFSEVAPLILYHHCIWNNKDNIKSDSEEVIQGSQILHLADRIDVLINKNEEILGQREHIRNKIEEGSGSMFNPELVEVFLNIAEKESFWFDTISPEITRILAKRSEGKSIKLSIDRLLNLAMMFSEIIDFRSEFTATHSSGVAVTSKILAELIGLSKRECMMIEIAGYLHDLGKLAIPPEILDKPGKLTKEEFNIIKSHPFYTYRILERVKGLNQINKWASFHHERIDGAGYPFHYGEDRLVVGSRIIAVADVFTAITENRPYRDGMNKDKAMHVLQDMAKELALDSDIVLVLKRNYDYINNARKQAQKREVKNYKDLAK